MKNKKWKEKKKEWKVKNKKVKKIWNLEKTNENKKTKFLKYV